MKLVHKLTAAGLILFMGTAFAACGETSEPKNEFGNLAIEDVKVYINTDKNYTFAEINPVFTVPEKAEALTYTYDTAAIAIADNVVTPVKRADKTYTVRAKSEHFEADFKVEVEYLRWSGSDATLADFFDVSNFPVAVRTETCKAINENTTLLIGDSFMDDAFIGDYMATYSVGKEIMNAGMSSTTSYHWERAYEEIIGKTAPKNIAVHVGTNNFYDAHDAVEDTTESLKRLLMYLHTSYPASNIYWFNITQRTDTAYAQNVTETNTNLANWCAKYEWVTCVDTSSKISSGMLKDGVHPKTEHYKVFTDALVNAGCEIAAKA